MDQLLTELREFAYKEVEETGMPIKLHVDLATEKGIELAKKLNANVQIVETGTLMMDCVLGQAIQAGKAADHVQMCYEATKRILDKHPEVSDSDKENILQCVLQHHGGVQFHSLESEICCNADCYRFATVRGVVIAIRYLREMPFEEMTQLVRSKVDEKWGVITLGVVREELTTDYELIQGVLTSLN